MLLILTLLLHFPCASAASGSVVRRGRIMPNAGAIVDEAGAKLVKQNEPDLKDLPDDCCSYDGRPASSYRGRWASIEKALKESKAGSDGGTLSVIDVGSNFGFFSLQTAMHFPKAFIFGIEGSVGAGNGNVGMNNGDISHSPGVQNHLKWIRELGLHNSVIATEVLDYERVSELQGRGFIADAMLLLSVFHHIDNAASSQYGSHGFSEKIEGTVSLMSKMLDLATMHFVELPNLGNRAGDPMRMPHMYEKYGSVENFLQEAMQKSSRPKVLKGPIYVDDADWLDDQGHRPIYLIQDAQDTKIHAVSIDELRSAFEGHVFP